MYRISGVAAMFQSLSKEKLPEHMRKDTSTTLALHVQCAVVWRYLPLKLVLPPQRDGDEWNLVFMVHSTDK